MKQWAVTSSKMLKPEEILRLFQLLKDAKDLAIHRGSPLSAIRDYFLLHGLLETGLRNFEFCDLVVSDFTGKTLVVRKGKGSKTREVLLTPDTQKLFRDFLKIKTKVLNEPTTPDSPLFLSEREGPYSTRGLRKRVKIWFKRAGINPKLSTHSCRHSYISSLIKAGVDLSTVKANAGHASLSTVSIYAHALSEDLEEISLYKSADFSSSRNNLTNTLPSGQNNDGLSKRKGNNSDFQNHLEKKAVYDSPVKNS